MNSTRFAAAAAVLLLNAVTTHAAVTIPDAIKVANNAQPTLVLHAKGVQVYECQAKKDAPTQFEWSFKEPQAELMDAAGKVVGKHYAGPTWEGSDGSKAVGSVKARADSPDGKAIPWLLLSATSTGNGMFGKISSIQRVATVGGKAPATCLSSEMGKQLRVDYTADYYFYTAQ